MAFFKTPGIEALYSGDTITNPLAASSRWRNASAPVGIPSAVSVSPS
jgi:hypothetical protein